MWTCDVCGEPLRTEYLTIETDRRARARFRLSCTNVRCAKVAQDVEVADDWVAESTTFLKGDYRN